LAVRPELRWVLLTVGIVGVLLGVSALALTQPNVVWSQGKALCPHCGTPAALGARRCAACREEFAWTAAPDEESPFSRWSLSPLEEQVLRDRVNAVGRDTAAERVATALGIQRAAAASYLEQLGVGRCGWCGGTGRDLAASEPDANPCPACLGRGRSIACDGDRRIRIGDVGAGRELPRYLAQVEDIARKLPLELQRQEVRRLTDAFLSRWHGTEEAARAWFWPDWEWTSDGSAPTVVNRCRERIDDVLRSLEARP
jgi:hypothetical protein